MKTSEKLEANWKAGLWTEIKNGHGEYRLITMKNKYGGFYATFPQDENGSWANHCATATLSPEYIDTRDWQIIRTIHPSELMGPGYEAEQKVRIKPNAKEECEKGDYAWHLEKQKMFEDGFGYVKCGKKSYLDIWNKNRSNWFIFPPTAIEPYFEDEEEKETIEIGGSKYLKREFEEAVKNLKPLE